MRYPLNFLHPWALSDVARGQQQWTLISSLSQRRLAALLIKPAPLPVHLRYPCHTPVAPTLWTTTSGLWAATTTTITTTQRLSWDGGDSTATTHPVASAGSPPSPSSPSDSASSSGSTASTLTVNHAAAFTQSSPIATPSIDIRSRSVSAPSSRSSSFGENLDRLAFIGPSAHKFPAALTTLSPDLSRGEEASPSLRSARSTPSSPRLAPLSSSSSSERRAVSRPSSPSFSRRSAGTSQADAALSRTLTRDEVRNRRRRARSWVNSPGSGFTPASVSTSTPVSDGSHMARSRPARQSSSPGVSVGVGALAENGSPGRYGRMRSTSASSATSPPLRREPEPVLRPIQRRQHSSSARTSPTVTPLQALTPMEQHQPIRTNSVPHLARMSPIVYGYGYHYPSGDSTGQQQQQQSQLDFLDGYFALPPQRQADPTSMGAEEMPPPYTASQVELHALVCGQGSNAAANLQGEEEEVRGNEEEEEEEEEGDEEREDGVLSFSIPRRSAGERGQGVRRRRANEEESEERGVGPVEEARARGKEEEQVRQQSHYRRLIITYILLPLRLLAVVPGCIGSFWLLRNAILLLWLEGSIWQGKDHPSALEFGLSSLWSIATAYHALSFTTLLLRRWLLYYAILPSFIRLIALQAICWPLVRITLYILGARNPLAGWVIVSTTTAFSDTVARWVVSNIADDSGPSTAAFSEQQPQPSSSLLRGRKKKRRTSMAFWKAVMGGPSEEWQRRDQRRQRQCAAGPLPSSSGTNRTQTRHRTTESEAESDVDGINGRARRLRPGWDAYLSELTSGGEESSAETTAGSQRSDRVARFFHWDVTIRRNVLPLAILGYLSMWALLLERVR